MINAFSNFPEYIITSIISSISIVIGAVIGGIFSWIVTKKSTDKTIEVQNKIVEDNRRYSESIRVKKSRECANIIRLDICTALFICIRTLKTFVNKENVDIYPIPMDKNYSSGVAYLKADFKLKELSYIYQLYGIIEKLNKDATNINYFDKKSFDIVKTDIELFLKKVYDKNFIKILNVNIDEIGYEELYDNELAKTGYRKVLKKLDTICINE
ncbi:hypothetical protein [Clostridium sp. DJ247]|uniref:hypothetical protein n=1 Tax=Clostridium sp. DJ247 TaxID=2726188 RepID=UPI00162951E6|nr:hypothetical protein [Clostridium sp. DJ247]MBC2580991.1 hypothetical protein [Clostridium sp. DJ247]